MFGFGSLGGEGGFSGSSSATSRAGPITVGGLTFAPGNNNASMIAVGVVAVVIVAFVLLKKA